MEISIKKPCHENWSDMTRNEQGAFCGKCVKTVVDFSTKSLEEIKDFFTGREQQKVCGRFEEKQLTALSFDAFFERFRRFEFTKRFAVILYFTFGLWLFGASSASAQNNEHVKGDVMVKERVEMGNVVADSDKKDTTACVRSDPSLRPVMGAVSHQVKPQTYKMGKVAPVKQTPVKTTPIKTAPVKTTPLKTTPVKQTPAKETTYKMGYAAPAPEKSPPKK